MEFKLNSALDYIDTHKLATMGVVPKTKKNYVCQDDKIGQTYHIVDITVYLKQRKQGEENAVL